MHLHKVHEQVQKGVHSCVRYDMSGRAVRCGWAFGPSPIPRGRSQRAGARIAAEKFSAWGRECATDVPPVATAEDTAKVADIDLTDKDFWRGALQTIADQIDLFCRIVQKEN